MLLTAFDIALYCGPADQHDLTGRQPRPRPRWLAGRSFTRTPML